MGGIINQTVEIFNLAFQEIPTKESIKGAADALKLYRESEQVVKQMGA